MALVGWISDVPPFTCAVRALMGAVALYVLTTVVGRVVINIVIDAIIKSSLRSKKTRNTFGEHTD